ncbi:Serine carboxypeptidase-like 49 [Auxenochlorella protothecoides]|uniref:Carboxypeptidase n=1 Tax=Auxenochlorella protothecoides TaxID=3075 RepID=A0A087SDW5_AUXPR|nr:Serine carboxypeptidase-like 49 [Auxenochlorella protothecoides]KFM23919.1 Serine carboxypeptidase-like 49 [Auxenochlorella protothecoides]
MDRPTKGLGVGKEPERYSGYYDLNRTTDGHMFFFYFQAREDPENAPLVLWMTGCSSELAVFFENGPYRLSPNQTVEETTYGWDVSANMIFVDQPLYTGFSYSTSDDDRCFDEKCVSNDMLDFFLALYEVRPELAGKDLFITGESYAGHYVPAVASRLFRASKSGEVATPFPLKGLAIGNGLTNPAIQAGWWRYGAYADYLLANGKIGRTLYSYVSLINPLCRWSLGVCDQFKWQWECLLAVNFCQAVTFVPLMAANPGMNVYDIRKPCVGPLCYAEFEVLDTYLNLPEVQEGLGVNRKWKSCNMRVHAEMMEDWPHDFSHVLPELLAGGVRALIYAGDQDFICNWLGNRRWVDALPWAGAGDWRAARDARWTVDGEQAGVFRTAGPLTFLKVGGAGHMVPMDQPKHGLDMITRFIRDEPFGPQPEEDDDNFVLGQPIPRARAVSRRQGESGLHAVQ